MKVVVSNEREIVYCKPLTFRVCSGVTALLFVGALALVMASLSNVLTRQAWQDMAPVEIVGRGALMLYLLLTLFVPLLLWYTAGPEELIVDLLTGAYRFRRGFPLLAKWQTGPRDDIRCLYTQAYKRQNNRPSYHALLAWKSDDSRSVFLVGNGDVRRRNDVLLGLAKTPEAAMQQIAPLASALNIPSEDGTLPENRERNSRYPRRQQHVLRRLALGGMMLMLLLLTAPDAIIGQMLQAQGLPATGTVIDRRRGKQNYLKVEYQVNGKTYQIKDKVTDVVYEQTPTGSRIRLLYLPDYPHTARTTLSNAAFYGRAMLGLYGALTLLAVIGLPLTDRYKRKPNFTLPAT